MLLTCIVKIDMKITYILKNIIIIILVNGVNFTEVQWILGKLVIYKIQTSFAILLGDLYLHSILF